MQQSSFMSFFQKGVFLWKNVKLFARDAAIRVEISACKNANNAQPPESAQKNVKDAAKNAKVNA